MSQFSMTFDLAMASFKGSVGIIGLGQDGTDLLGLLLHEKDVNVVCIVEEDSAAPGLALARKRNIPVRSTLKELIDCKPDLIFRTTKAIELSEPLPSGTELIDVMSVGLILTVLKKHYMQHAKLEETADEARSYLSHVLENIADSVITTNMTGHIVEFNPGAERIFGFSREEMCGKNIESLWITPEKRREILIEMNRHGYISNYETELYTKDGKVIDTSITLSYIKNHAGERLGTVGITKDITERKRMERALEEKNLELKGLAESLEEKVMERTQELRKANADLERLNKVKSQFIATMSHELRTPLNSILGFSELLLEDREGTLSDKQKRYISNVYTSGSHLLQLINNILDIAKIESGKMDVFKERFSVSIAMDEVSSVVKPLMDKKQLRYSVNISEEISYINADRVKFKQVLYNLLSNAAKFTPEKGDVVLTATVSNEKLNGHLLLSTPEIKCLKISVADTGIGIKSEDMDRIFSEFEQADSSYSRRYEGTGLGLSLTRKLVDLHHGKILVQSEENKGSVFTVLLPLEDSERYTEPAIFRPMPTVFEDPIIKRSGSAPLIVVVEDDNATRELMTLYLADGGYRVASVKSGDEALSKIRELQPFAVILDVMLPGKDGWEILQEIKSDPDLRDIPVVMATMVENQELGFALGASDYMVKPIDKNSLVKKLETLSIANKRHRKPTSILCVDDHEDVRELLKETLESGGYTVITADSGREGIEKAIVCRPDLIILDLMMPEMDGFQVIEKLKANQVTQDIPICILTAKDLSVSERLELADKIESYMQKSYFTKDQLLTHIKDLEVLYPVRAGLIDEVSGLLDRCYFHLRMAQELSRAARYNKTFSVIALDLDDFSLYRDTFGNINANSCIKKIAEFLKKTVRGSDTVVRYGYDEFAGILTDTITIGAIKVATRIEKFIQTYPFHGIQDMPRKMMSATIVVLSYPADAKSPEEFMAMAHDLMSRGKRAGGARVVTIE